MIIAVLLCILALLLLLYYTTKRNKNYGDIDRIPGPPTLPFFGNIFDFGITKSDILTNLVQLNKQYGPMFKLWMGPTCVNLVVSGPEYIEKILVTKANNDKGLFYKFADDWLGDSFLITSGEKWYLGRKCVAPYFNAINVEKFIPVFNTNANKLVKNLKALGIENQIHIDRHILSCTLDNIFQTLFCTAFDENSKQKFWENFKTQSDVLVNRMFSMFKRFEWIFRLTKDYQIQKKSSAEGHKLVDAIVITRKEERLNNLLESNHKILLDVLLDRCESDDKYTLRNVYEDINAIIAAASRLGFNEFASTCLTLQGSETTAIVLSSCIYQLSKFPEVQTKLSKEIEEILGDDDVTTRAIQEMQYLDCVLKETMRLYTPVPIIERTMAEDLTLDGKRIPKGTSILIFLLGVHQNEQLYPEPEKFNPDRFLPENCKSNSCSFVPFSVGPRNCLGQKFGMAEAKVIMCKIITNFEIKEVQGHKPKLELEVMLRSANGLPVVLKPKKI